MAATSADILGGYLLPSPLSTMVIDLARNQACVTRAGAITIPMESNTLDIACLTKDPTAAWKAENAPATPSDPNVGRLSLRARTLIGMVKSSVELLEDAPNCGTIIRNGLSQALALELDRAALRGIGAAEEPLGIRNWTSLGSDFGAQLIELGSGDGGILDAYDTFSQAVQKIQEVNGPTEGLSVIYTPREGGTLDRWKDGQGLPLIPPASWTRLAKFVTNQIPTDLGEGTESEAYVGDFTQLGIGMRTTLTLEVSRQAADAEGSAFTNLQVWIRAYLRADVVLLQPTWFVVINRICPPG